MSKYVGKIPEELVGDDGIKWLVIEPHIHENEVVGYFMYFYKKLNEDAIWDNWFQSLKIAFEAATAFGLREEDWKIMD